MSASLSGWARRGQSRRAADGEVAGAERGTMAHPWGRGYRRAAPARSQDRRPLEPTGDAMSLAPAPPRFGRSMLAEWRLDPGVLYLNHGTVGAPPIRVLEAQQRIRDEIERQPSRFLLRELSAVSTGPSQRPTPRMREAAAAVASFVGSRAEDLVFVDNATAGANAVLRSLDWHAGDEVVLADVAYGAVILAARHATRRHGAEVRLFDLPYPIRDEQQVVDAFVAAIGPRTRLMVVDHIVAETAVILPVRAIADACRARGVAVLVDGAHAPGALPLDLPALGADWYTGNLHKWAMSPRSSAILWAPPERQHELHPPVISWGLDQGFAEEFDLVGTRDPSPHLSAPAAIAFMNELGLDRMRAYNHELVWGAANALAARWGVALGVPERMVGCMASLPLPERAGSAREQATAMRTALLYEDGIEAPIHAWRGRLWTRLSAQVYNEAADFERLGDAIDRRIGRG